MIKEKIALFDFDKTICKGDSLTSFVWFSKNIAGYGSALQSAFYGILWFLKLKTAEQSKLKALNFLKSTSKNYIDDLGAMFINKHKSNLYNDAIKEIKILKQQGYKVIIVSASPYFYLQHLIKMLPIDAVISTNLEFSNDLYTGKFSSKNCYGIEKPKRINAYLKENNIELDYDNSCSYSDSFSDKPMLDMVKRKYIINANNKLKNKISKAKYDVEYKNWR